MATTETYDSGSAGGGPDNACSTKDPTQAHQWLCSTYADHTAKLIGGKGEFDFRGLSSSVDSITFSRFHHPFAAEVQVHSEREILIALRVTEGRFRVGQHGKVVEMGPGDSALLPPEGPLSIAWDDVKVTAVTLERQALQRSAAEIAAQSPCDIVFDLARPCSRAAEVGWWNTVAYLDQTLRRASAGAGPFIRAEATRLLTAVALETFPYRGTIAPATEEKFPGRPWLKHALSFIDENAHRAIGLTEIAAAARVSPRALQAGFQSQLNATPLQYLRDVRLTLAHAELKSSSAREGDTVAAIADRWGFFHHGRFSAAYAKRYGHAPSEDLRG
jgi:AraC-like DNA-binding protein/quercetin dioxygenase-like cupin family protein